MKTNPNYEQYIPTRILFGAGALNNLHAQPMPGKRALIVISNGNSTRANGYLARTEEQLLRASCTKRKNLWTVRLVFSAPLPRTGAFQIIVIFFLAHNGLRLRFIPIFAFGC